MATLRESVGARRLDGAGRRLARYCWAAMTVAIGRDASWA
jgi:hypothetical protein